MKKISMLMVAVATLTFFACSSDDNEAPVTPDVADFDNDGIVDADDNCESTANPDQADGDGDGIGDVCDPDTNGDPQAGDIIEVSANITSDTTWESDFIYQLNGRIAVESGTTLTIEAGTLIKGSAGQGTNASVLLIARGATLNANGTAADPIVMTSTADNLAIGQTSSPNLTENDRGLWGGLIILGAAPISVADNSGTAQIEGIPASDSNGNYGGDTADDNSGSITYVSVRHGGTNIGSGNEINGITLGGVGSGTVLNHLEVIANVDDGIEFFGGTADASNLIVWAQGDDAIDIDQAYSGTITNVVVVQGGVSDHAFEIDGPEGNLDGAFTLENVSLYGNENASNGEYADYRSGATGATNNIFATGFPASKDVELDNNGVTTNYNDGLLTFSAWEIIGAGSEIFAQKVGCAENCNDDDDDNDIPEVPIASDFETDAAGWTTTVAAGEETVGADTSVFAWTVTNAESSAF
ncbi:MAG: hypothetical protein ABJN84_09630 [Flavobacteriaceae bacterium]